jgi:type IV pilus assembly protein PilQ
MNSQAAERQETLGKTLEALKNVTGLDESKLGLPAVPVNPSVSAPTGAVPEAVAPPVTADTFRGPRPPKASIDRDGEGDDKLSIHIQDADIREVLDMISEQGGINILAANSVQGRVSASLNGVDIDSALHAILKSTGFTVRREGKFVYVGTAADLQLMDESVDKVGSRLYRPNYITASELTRLVQPLLTPSLGICSISSPAQSGIAPDGSNAGGDGFAGGEAVLVRDFEAVLAQVDQVFSELDKQPSQVHIEAMILSVKLNDKNTFGVDFALLRNEANVRLVSGQPLQTLTDMSFNGGLKVGFLDSSLGVFLNALETIGDTNVIATPQLMCINKHKAEVLIGAQLGYVNTTLTETSTAQNVQFLEIGTQLRLRPFISSDGMIRMEVHPELSTGRVRVEEGFTLPDKEVTQVTTNIMVRDGCTVIIGGLKRENLDTTASQIPFLGSAPGIGFLFRQKTGTIERHELIVLITPRIVCEPQAYAEADRGAGEFHRRQSVYADSMSPIGTRYLGRKYFRIAQDLWAQGQGARAVKAVNLSIHFDPTNRAAIDLRSDIMAGSHIGDHSGGNGILSGNTPTGGEIPGPIEVDVPGLIQPIERPNSLR